MTKFLAAAVAFTVTGASIMNPSPNANIAAFVRNGITIKEPKDFVGPTRLVDRRHAVAKIAANQGRSQ